MKLTLVLGIIVIIILITLYEWPKMSKNQKKEKWAFVTLTVAGGVLAVLLVYFPDMPGPIHLLDAVFRPLKKLLGNNIE